MAADESKVKAAAALQNEMVYSACICCYQACNFSDIFIVCQGSGTCICLESKSCLAAGVEQFPIGMIQEDGFICKIGLPCCTYGLKNPDMKDLISSDQRCLCTRTVAQFPFGDKIKGPICAYCCLQCVPECGCAKPGPGGSGDNFTNLQGGPDNHTMQR